MKVLFRGIAMLCVLQLSLLAGTAHSQEREGTTVDNHKFFYGVHVGYTINKVDIYSAFNGTTHALEEGNHTIYAPGLRIAVIGEATLGRYFNLRVMPGVSLFKSKWEPTGSMLPAYLQSPNYKMESVCSEVPIDVKFHPLRIVNLNPKLGSSYLVPYLTAGLCHKFDFTSLHRNNDNESIQPLNAHDLNVSFGLGLDCYTQYLKFGLEFKASHGLLSPGNGGSDPLYFHNSNCFSIGLNIEA